MEEKRTKIESLRDNMLKREAMIKKKDTKVDTDSLLIIM